MAMASPSSRTETAPSRSSSSPFASSSSANFAPRPSPLLRRSSSSAAAARVRRYGRPSTSLPPSPTSSVRFSIDQLPVSPGRRSISGTKKQRNDAVSSNHKRTCMCSPTMHPGSFRCAYHKRLAEDHQRQQQQQQQTALSHSSSGSRLNLRRSAMKNSLVRIGGVEGELVRRALTNLIRPSSHQQRRRDAFQPRPSRLSLMSKAQDL